MFRKRAERRRQARAAIERYEYQHANDTAQREAVEARAMAAEQRESDLRGQVRGLQARLDDANAELARWGLKPCTRDEPEADDHPQRYRRHSDWRTTRTPRELTELLERSSADVIDEGDVEELACRTLAAAAPDGVDVSIDYTTEGPAGLRKGDRLTVHVGRGSQVFGVVDDTIVNAMGEVEVHLAQPAPAPLEPDVVADLYEVPVSLAASDAERMAALRRMRDTAIRERDAAREDLRVAEAGHTRYRDRAEQTIYHLRTCLGEAHAANRQRRKTERGQARKITALLQTLEEVARDVPPAGVRIDGPAVLTMIEPGDPVHPAHPLRAELAREREASVALREALELEKMRSRERRENDLAVLATELGWPGEEEVTINGLCLRVRDLRAEYEDAGPTPAEVAEERLEELAEERTAREHAERSRDRAVAEKMDVQRWREKERGVLADLVNALAPAVEADTLHPVLQPVYERAAALLEDPDS